jgi:hypothetical protein
LWVVDQGNARNTVLDTAGRVQESHVRPFSNFFSGRWFGMMDAAGTIYEAYRSFGKGDALLRLDSALQVSDTIFLPSVQGEAFKIEEKNLSVTASVPFAQELRWRLDSLGYLWWGMNGPVPDRATEPWRRHSPHYRAGLRAVAREWGDKDSAVARLKWFADQGGKVDPSRSRRSSDSCLPIRSIADLVQVNWGLVKQQWPGTDFDWSNLRIALSSFLGNALNRSLPPFRHTVMDLMPWAKLPRHKQTFAPEVFWQAVALGPEPLRPTYVAIAALGSGCLYSVPS